MTNDPIGDFLIRIKNAYRAGRKEASAPYSKIIFSLAQILSREGYVGVVTSDTKQVKKTVSVGLLYNAKIPKIADVERVSSPGCRIYVKKGQSPRVLSGLGISILSTPLGLLTSKEAWKKGVGGELLCRVW
jgi:small subunit ribosomal protein S8